MIGGLLRHGKLVVGFWLLLLVLALGAIGRRFWRNLPLIDNSVAVWFLDDDPDLVRYQRHNMEFGQEEWSLVLVQTANIWDPAFLQSLDSLTRQLQILPHVHKVVSLTNARDSRPTLDSAVEYAPLWSVSLPEGERADSLRARAALVPMLQNSLLRQGDTQHVALLLLADNFLHDPSPYRIELVDSVRSLALGHSLIQEVHFAGTTVVNAELNRSAGHDAVKFYLLVTLLVVGVGYLALRTVRDVTVVLGVICTAVVIPMGVLAALGVPYNMVTIMLPPVLVSLAVCDIIHVINAFHIQRRTKSAANALKGVLSRLLVSCVWTTVVTVVGFLSLAPSTVMPIRQLGLCASLGLLLALASTLTLGPVLLAGFWPHSQESDSARTGWRAGQYAQWLYPKLFGRWRILWMALAVACLVPVLGLSKLEVDTDYTKFFSAQAPLTKAYRAIDQAGWAQSLMAIDIRAPHPDSLSTRRWRDSSMRFETEVQRLPQVKKTLSQQQILARVDAAWSGGPDSARFAGYGPDKIRNLRFLADLSGNDDLGDFSNVDGSVNQILTLTPYMSSRQLELFRHRIDSLARRILPFSAQVSLEGTPVLWSNMDRQISRTQVSSFVALALVFFVLLPLLFRSLTLGLIGVVINGLPLCMTFGLMGFLGVKINLATALIGGVSIGSTVDSTIFFINRFRAALADGLGWEAAVRTSVLEVGDGVLVTSALLAGGFLCMVSSSFLPTAHFGIFTTFTVLTAVFFDIVIDPILLSWLGKAKT